MSKNVQHPRKSHFSLHFIIIIYLFLPHNTLLFSKKNKNLFFCAFDSGSPRLQRCNSWLLSSWVAHPESSLSIPRDSRLILQRRVLQFTLLIVLVRYVCLSALFSSLDLLYHILPSSSSFTAEKKLQYSRAPRAHGSPPVKNPVVRSKSYNVPMLTPVVEYDIDSSSGGSAGIRRHSVCEMSSCMEESSSLTKSAARVADDTSASNSSTASTTSVALTGKPNRGLQLLLCHCASQESSPLEVSHILSGKKTHRLQCRFLFFCVVDQHKLEPHFEGKKWIHIFKNFLQTRNLWMAFCLNAL